MKIAAVFLGRAGEVRRRVRKVARALVEADSFANYDLGPLTDTNETEGLVLMSVDRRVVGVNYHPYILTDELMEATPAGRTPKELVRDWLLASLDVEWRFICTLGQDAGRGFTEADVQSARSYVEAAVRFWPALAAERSRISLWGGNDDFVEHWYPLFRAVEVLGISAAERMVAPRKDPIYFLEMLSRRMPPK